VWGAPHPLPGANSWPARGRALASLGVRLRVPVCARLRPSASVRARLRLSVSAWRVTSHSSKPVPNCAFLDYASPFHEPADSGRMVRHDGCDAGQRADHGAPLNTALAYRTGDSSHFTPCAAAQLFHAASRRRARTCKSPMKDRRACVPLSGSAASSTQHVWEAMIAVPASSSHKTYANIFEARSSRVHACGHASFALLVLQTPLLRAVCACLGRALRAACTVQRTVP